MWRQRAQNSYASPSAEGTPGKKRKNKKKKKRGRGGNGGAGDDGDDADVRGAAVPWLAHRAAAPTRPCVLTVRLHLCSCVDPSAPECRV